MAVSFKGGKKLKTYKYLTENAVVHKLPLCDECIFPISFCTGTRLEPIVKIGDEVKVGQKIADTEDYLAVPVHSSVSGIVTDIRDEEVLKNVNSSAIVIESDGLYSRINQTTEITPEKYTTRELLWLIRDAGIIEPDGEPAHLKLNPPRSVKFVIANCAESDLYATSKQKLIENHTEDIISGLKTAMRILNVSDGYIGVEAHLKDCFSKLKRLLRYDTSLHLLKLKQKYPQSDETQIIKAITGLDTPSGSVVLDAKTLYDISQAINHGRCVTERIVTVSGNAVKKPANFLVPLGVSVSFLVKNAGGLTNESARVVTGGGIKSVDVCMSSPITKNTDAILALSDQTTDPADENCGICRKCVPKCPMRINPKLLSNTFDIEKAEKHFILDCTECGLCSFICPKHREPMKKLLMLQKNVRQKSKDNA